MFAAAFAGAPVGNMTSAYGGVRWESGLVRAFQYEKGQSRIGKTLWEDREAYIRNSPLFYLDKVHTPLLLMNNDNDGAVPWYQGIEIYNGLRRLEQPVWLLNYNGDAHNLTKLPNQVDLSRRMLQFFNHYLKGQPMPKWMSEGVPAVDKGKVTGYELTSPDGK
jgi:dipeptidyl aminopeptidase/acylaminoacyl peptidase